MTSTRMHKTTARRPVTLLDQVRQSLASGSRSLIVSGHGDFQSDLAALGIEESPHAIDAAGRVLTGEDLKALSSEPSQHLSALVLRGVIGAGRWYLERWLSSLSLHRLDLSWNFLDDDSISDICRSLSSHTELSHVNFSHNHIEDKGARRIAEWLPSRKRLEFIDVSRNWFGDRGAELVVRALYKSRPKARLFMGEQLPGGITRFVDEMRRAPTEARVLFDSLAGVPLRQAKLMVVGQPNVGKTSLTCVLRGKKPPSSHWPTNAFEVHEVVRSLPVGKKDEPVGDIVEPEPVEPEAVKPEPVDCTIRILDFAGQEVVHPTHRFALTARCVYIIVIDATRKVEGVTEQEGNRLEHWMRLVKYHAPDAPVVVIANHSDRVTQDSPIDWRRQVAMLGKAVGIGQVHFMPGISLSSESLRTGEEAADYAATQLWPDLDRVLTGLGTFGQLVPSTFGQLLARFAREREQRRKFPVNGVEKLDWFYRLCNEDRVYAGVSERQLPLLRILHEFAILFCWDRRVIKPDKRSNGVLTPAFEGVLQNRLFDPEWLKEHVYRIVTVAAERHRPILEYEEAVRLVSSEAEESEPEQRTELVLGAMRRFGLLVPLGDAAGNHIHPHWLSESKPDIGRWNAGASWLGRFDFVPDDFVARLMVDLHQSGYVKFRRDGDGFSNAWRYGVVSRSILDHNDPRSVEGLVSADLELREVTVAVRGGEPKGREEFRLALQAAVERLLKSQLERWRLIGREESTQLPEPPSNPNDIIWQHNGLIVWDEYATFRGCVWSFLGRKMDDMFLAMAATKGRPVTFDSLGQKVWDDQFASPKKIHRMKEQLNNALLKTFQTADVQAVVPQGSKERLVLVVAPEP